MATNIASATRGTMFLYWVSFAAAAASYLCQPVYNPEIFGYVTRGNWIHANYAVPVADLWTEAGIGAAWHDGSWLFEVICSLLFNAYGQEALALLKLLLCFGFVSAVCWVFAARAKDGFVGGFLAFITSVGVLSVNVLTPGLAAFTLFVLTLEFARRTSEAATKKNVILLLLITAAYSNVHGSVLAAALISYLLFYASAREDIKRQFRFLYVVAGLFVSPYLGAHLLTYLREFNRVLLFDIASKANPGTIFQYAFVVLVLEVVLLGFFTAKSARSINPLPLAAVALMTLAAWMSQAVAPYALCVAGYVLAETAGEAIRGSAGNLVEGLRRLKSSLMKLPALGVIWLGLCVIVVNGAALYRLPVILVHMPSAALDFIVEKDAAFPLLHPLEYGGYISYRLSGPTGSLAKLALADERGLLFDRRLVVLTKEIFRAARDWEGWLAELEIQSILCKTDDPIYNILTRDPSWTVAFRSSKPEEMDMRLLRGLPDWAVFTRRSAPPAL